MTGLPVKTVILDQWNQRFIYFHWSQKSHLVFLLLCKYSVKVYIYFNTVYWLTCVLCIGHIQFKPEYYQIQQSENLNRNIRIWKCDTVCIIIHLNLLYQKPFYNNIALAPPCVTLCTLTCIGQTWICGIREEEKVSWKQWYWKGSEYKREKINLANSCSLPSPLCYNQ